MALSEDVVAALRRLRLGHPPGRGRQRRRRHRGGDRGRPRRRPAEPDRRPDAHRLRQPEQAGQPEGARRAARPRRGPPRQGGLRLGPGRDVLRSPTRRWRVFREAVPNGERLVADWRDALRRLRRRRTRSSPPSSAAGSPASCRRAGTRTSRPTRPAPRWRRATPARTRSRRWRRACPELFGGAADLSESNLTDVKGEANFSADESGPQPALRRPRARDGRRSPTASPTTAASSRTSRRS